MAAAPKQVVSKLKLEPKQGLAFQTEATEVLYGGAAGGGKSYLLRASAIRWCAEVPGIQVYMFRRTLPDLRDNHLRGPTSFHAMLEPYLATGNVRYRSVENEFEFWNGAVLHLCYCDSENDVEKYRGAEIHVLIIDELTHFSEYQVRFLRSRVRIAGLKVPGKYALRLPRFESASNPGSIGHAWVKRTYISPKPPMEIWRVSPEEGGMLRQFIPARLADNPYLTRDDPAYADRLRGLGADNLVRAMLEGDWDIVAGQAFEKLRRDTHCIEPFDPPQDWMCFGSFDWGSTRPFSFGLWAVANGNALQDGRLYRRGAIIRWNEIYGWNGKPNEGQRKEASDVAELIRSRVGVRKLGYIAADPSMWKVDGGPSIAEAMLRHGVVLRKADHSRLVGYTQVRQRISGDEDGPMLYATKNCHEGFWRTMPDLVMDERKVEDVDTDQEDHCFVAGTTVITDQGLMPIETAHGANVLTTDGFQPSGKVVARIAPCVRLTFDDGSTVECTLEHKFLTTNGWKRAVDLLDEISCNALCASNQLARLVRNFSKDQYRQESTSTTSTETAAEIISRISRSSTHRSIAPLVVSGTPNTRAATWAISWRRKFRSAVASAERSLWRSRCTRTARFIAALTARQKRCVAVAPIGKREVHCLHVFAVHNFALADGSIVHNCYDDTRYACMSRPWMAAVKKPEKKPDRWMRLEDEGANEDSWRTA